MSTKEDQLTAFRAFQFDKDEGYKRYLQNVELPATNLEQALLKVKAKWWKREKDADFNPEWVQAAAGARPTPAPSTQYTPPPQPHTYNGAPPPRTQPSSYGGAPLVPSVTKYGGTRMDQVYVVVANVALLVLALAFAIPFMPRAVSRPAYGFFLMLLMATSLHRLLLRHGRPSLTMQSLSVWGPTALTSNEGLALALGFIFRSQPPMLLLLVPPVINAVYELGDYAAANLAKQALWARFCAAPHRLLLARRRDVLLACASCEISIGFMLFIQLLSPARSFMLLFMYWHLLKAKYTSRDAGPMHQAVWRLIGQKASPLLDRVGPLKQAVGLVQSWFAGNR